MRGALAGAEAPPADTGSGAPAILGPTRAVRTWSWTMRRLPLVVYLAVYLFTCYVGALALWLSERFRTLFLIFSGATPPSMTGWELVVALLLLHLAPLLLWLGFELGLHTAGRRGGRPSRTSGRWPGDRLVAGAWLLLSALLAAWSLHRGGGFENFGAWLDYNAYVYARWRLFDRLGHWDYVNLYTLLPVAGAYLILKERRWTTTGLTILLVGLLQYPLAIRKVLLTSAILIGAALYIHLYAGAAPRRRAAARWHVAVAVGALLALYLFYVGLTLMQVTPRSARAFQTRPDAVLPAEPRREVDGRAELSFEPNLDLVAATVQGRVTSVTLFVLLSPLTRTSIAALAYPAIFPRWRPYYHLDVAQDMLRKIHPSLDHFGRMPDDNIVVYRILWPGHHRGTITAPYQFVLHSQGGLWIALGGSVVAGLLMGLWWSPVVKPLQPSAEASILGALAVVLGVFFAIDSLRNSILVSYGLVWGALPLLLLIGLSRRFRKPGDREAPA